MQYAIECTDLAKRYGDFALGPLDIGVERGTVTGLVGSNGAGKTTLIKLLLGLTRPDAGSIALLGQAITDPENLSGSVKARIGVVLDACSFTRSSRVADVARLGRTAYDDWDAALFSELVGSFELDPKKQVEKLSRGMGMKLSIAFALAHHPELLILDEATAGLDPIARDEVLDILRAFMLDEGHAILMSSHITSDLEKIADRIVCLDHGRIIFSEQRDAICSEAGIARLRATDLAALSDQQGAIEGALRMASHAFATDLLVADRFAFAKAHPEIPIDKASLEDYMNLMLKGEQL